MKKTLLAAALMAGFAGVAQAETSVTLYGILDAGVGYTKVSGNSNYQGTGTNLDSKATGIIQGVQSSNRWGLKGSEDLGNGLRAVFVLESGFGVATGEHQQGDRLFGRQATLGLASDAWGQLDIGRQTNIASKYFFSIDPFGAGFGYSAMGAAFTQANTARYDNMLMYQTPNFSGFQFGVGYSFNAAGAQNWDKDRTLGALSYDNDDLNKRAVTTGLRYSNGPLNVALTYDQMKVGAFSGSTFTLTPGTGVIERTAATGFNTTTLKAWALGGTYDFEVVKLHLAGGQTRNGLFEAPAFGDISGSARAYVGQQGMKVNSYMVGLSAPVGGGNVLASWTMADPSSKPNSAAAADEYDKQNIFSLGYTYALSKRTNLYAIGSYANNINFLPDAKARTVGVGIRHQF